MIFQFEAIPEIIGFSVFDLANRPSKDGWHGKIKAGDSHFEFKIPSSWQDPHVSIAPLEYFVPESYGPLDRALTHFNLTGADFFLDVTRDETREEQNRRSVEQILVQINQSENLSGRQKFYVSLMALNSHFEFLTHTILVTSGHLSKTQFAKLASHEGRIDAAFDQSNQAFFGKKFVLCPGKEIEPGNISDQALQKCHLIIQETRKLRNKVAHRWGYNDLTNDKLTEFFASLGTPLNYSPDDEGLFRNASAQFTVLWAQVGMLNTRAALVHEKRIIEAERTERGIAS